MQYIFYQGMAKRYINIINGIKYSKICTRIKNAIEWNKVIYWYKHVIYYHIRKGLIIFIDLLFSKTLNDILTSYNCKSWSVLRFGRNNRVPKISNIAPWTDTNVHLCRKVFFFDRRISWIIMLRNLSQLIKTWFVPD